MPENLDFFLNPIDTYPIVTVMGTHHFPICYLFETNELTSDFTDPSD